MAAVRAIGFVAATGLALVALVATADPDSQIEDGGAGAVVPALRLAMAAPGLALRGTIVSSDQRYSEALVDLGAGDLRRVRIGGSLGQWGAVAGIERQRILISRNGTLYEFTFNDSAPTGVVSAGVPAGDADGAGVSYGAGAEDLAEHALEQARLQRALRAREIQQARRRGESQVVEEEPEQIDEVDWSTEVIRDANGKQRTVRRSRQYDE